MPFDELTSLWSPKWQTGPETRISTFGSCFAQRFGEVLRDRGFAWVNGEPAPPPLSPEARRRYSYEVFSVRTGSIYTARQLLQWLNWSIGTWSLPTELWKKSDRFYDPFRPSIEPEGFASEQELHLSRQTTLRCLLEAIRQSDVLVFTLGLTECWRNVKGYEYQSTPGVYTDNYAPDLQYFHNQSFLEIYNDLTDILKIIHSIQPEIKLLLTVSPVPLTATASDQHVLVATTYSKAILRAVAGELAREDDRCDYFPSYDIVCSSASRGMFYKPNLRDVTRRGVNFIMDQFMTASAGSKEAGKELAAPSYTSDAADPLCDDAALEMFAKS